MPSPNPFHAYLREQRANLAGRGARAKHLEGIDPDVRDFCIGGYQPLKKWLQERKDRELDYHDQDHDIRITTALRETIRLMAEIDEAGLPFS